MKLNRRQLRRLILKEIRMIQEIVGRDDENFPELWEADVDHIVHVYRFLSGQKSDKQRDMWATIKATANDKDNPHHEKAKRVFAKIKKAYGDGYEI